MLTQKDNEILKEYLIAGKNIGLSNSELLKSECFMSYIENKHKWEDENRDLLMCESKKLLEVA